jgi:hypothetical protein
VARQRFIHPEIWKDPVYGKLQPIEQLLFIGLFSIADDEGRLLADAAYLRSEIFPFKDYTNKKVQSIRDAVVQAMVNVHLYRANGYDYIALLKWAEYQKPKYPKPSKLPPPFLEDSPKLPPRLPEASPTDSPLDRAGQGLGWEGQGRDDESQEPATASTDFKSPDPVARLLAAMSDKDDGTERELRKRIAKYHLAEGDLEEAREAALSPSAVSPTAVAMSVLKQRGEERSAA